MWCYIYRSSKKDNCYLYLDKDIEGENGLAAVPKQIQKIFGKPIFAMKLLLDPNRHFAACSAAEIEARIEKDGFFLQMLKEDDFKVEPIDRIK
ncbi:YcgL domain-containing protein [Orbaceae bacterium ESL0721]|nr:YcgL domain-containing protein [Orbaceae bacterium ESL0721]